MVAVVLCITFCLVSQGSGSSAGHGGFLSAEGIEAGLQEAIAIALGSTASERKTSVTEKLTSIFKVLPKNTHGRIERPMLRYALHRYFLREYSFMVRGLEPTQNAVNASALVTSEGVFRDRVPTFVEGVLEGRFFQKGFGLEDAALIATILEELVLEVPDKASEAAPKRRKSLTRSELQVLLDSYVLQWMVGDEADAQEFTQEQAVESIPQWHSILEFAHGEIDRLVDKHRRQGTSNAFRPGSFTLADFNSIVKSITSSFGVWWEQECQAIKSNLMSMDQKNSGRVRLSDFYHKSVGGEWRFSESVAYLRDLGALDESSRTDGPQVIIPNYLLGASNCIVTSTYYHVCCVNECEAKLSHIEDAVQGPVSPPEQVIMAVRNMTVEDEHGRFQGNLLEQLHQIANKHRGKIPLHGRLFRQWMHYAFPQECPYAHRAGSVQSKSPLEFGDEYLVKPTEVKMHTKAAKKHAKDTSETSVEDLWVSQLEAEDEELLTDYVEFSKVGLWSNALSFLIGGPAPILAGAAVCFLVFIASQGGLEGSVGGAKDGVFVLPEHKVYV
eukprot:gnl/MRDRNA2_/MRDRNA2_88390_c0_seq1.p1 gnl/MRDRNA2_/MRDRNA2_88390_c0~~gnl/MRDRNA2_/MRDRNA2_88390_c0_seq1.p1  ORF type:complete len:556 (+),score=120.68 gnl/MRDRNA2_/MRDRNA2_88390_c0_seq1:83-1750(+)